MNFKKYFNVNNNNKIAQTIEQTFFLIKKCKDKSASTNINELSNLGISVCSHLHGDMPSAGGEQMYAKFTVINLLGVVTVAFEQEKISLLYHTCC